MRRAWRGYMGDGMSDGDITPEVQALVDAAIGLKGIVEGIHGAMEHGTFRAERSNLRMKDTDEWVAFHNAITAWENRNDR